jgi:hypothetical protein
MNAALVALELRKNRLTLIGLALVFLLMAPLALLVAPRAGYGPRAAVDAGLILWTLAGLPLAAAVLGASAGASLRAEASREAEAPLPVSAASRVARGLAGAALQLLILAAVTSLICAAVSPGWRGTVLGAGEASDLWRQELALRGFFPVVWLDLLLTSYLCAYAIGHALAGGLLGAAWACAEAATLALGLQYSFFFHQRMPSFAPAGLLAAAAGLGAKLLLIPWLAERFERRRPMSAGRILAAAGLACVGLLAAAAAEERAWTRLREDLTIVSPRDGGMLMPRSLGSTEDEREASYLPRVYGKGLPAATVAAGLVWIAGDGTVSRLIPDLPVTRLVGPSWGGFIEALHRDARGNLFVVRRLYGRSRDAYELWGGRPETGLARIDLDLRSFAGLTLDRGRVILDRSGAAFLSWPPAPAQKPCALTGEAGAKACVPLAEAPAAVPEAAVLRPGSGRRAVRVSPRPGRSAVCRLPGAVPRGFDDKFAAVSLGGRPAWFVPFDRGRDPGLAVCRADGRVEKTWTFDPMMLWPLGSLDLNVLADGSVVYQSAYTWRVATAGGEFLPLIDSKTLFQRWPRPAGAYPFTPELVRRFDGKDWIVFEADRLVVMNEKDGTPLRAMPLPHRAYNLGMWKGLSVLDGGLVLSDDYKTLPTFVDWDGRARPLMAP